MRDSGSSGAIDGPSADPPGVRAVEQGEHILRVATHASEIS